MDVGSLSDALRRLKKAGYNRDYMIIDTPGSFMNIIKDAIEVADCLVLPLQASPLDFLAQKDVAADIEAMGKKGRTVFVLNKADMRSSLTTEILNLLEPLSPHPPMVIHQRVAYRHPVLG
jgi:cellulose biosynthesis protein BcsQ